MNEIDKIIEKGLLPKSYFEEEVKCGFKVTTERKKLFAIILDLLVTFDDVCKKHNLKYFLHAGSLLGAIRHHGFIPWDDDLDVTMPREDYDKLVLLSKEFNYPYFLQTPYTDNGYFYSFAKIRNSNTTGIVDMFKYAGFNQGIWLTIFPLDYWDISGGEERYAKIRELVMHESTYMRINNPKLNDKDRKRVEKYLSENRNPIDDYEEIERLASSCKFSNSRYVTTAVITQSNYSDKLWDACDYSESIMVEFEGFKVPIPCGYSHLLEQWYGDYMKFPPVEERGLWHDGTVFDADISYKDYLKNEGIIL